MALRRLRIRVLGRLEVLHDDAPAPLPASKKTRAMLGYLVVTGRAHTREKLCDLLWDAPDDPRAALRWTLWKLRPLVDDRATSRLLATRDRVAFEPHGADVDLASVRRALAGGAAAATTDALAEAAAAFRGELLEGLELDECFRWHQWYLGEREALRAAQRTILDALVERLADERPEDALVHARARLAADAFSEEAHLAVMQLLARLGRTREAIAQHDAWVAICESELRTRPSSKVLAWRTSLAARPPSSAPPPAPPPLSPPAPPEATPLVGRAAEVDALDAFLGGDAAVLLLAGEPGIGKTRLLDELAARAAATPRGARVVRARAFEAERRRAYGPWIDAFGGDVPELSGSAKDRDALWSAVARALAGEAASRPVLVILDDLHWADEESAALLHHLARVLPPTGAHVRFAAAVRGGELGDNLPCLRVVRALARDRRLLRVAVAPLARESAEALARAVRPDVDASRVADESEGNPLFVVELARAPREAAAVPATLEDLLDERLERLDDGARQALDWLATFGRDASAELLARAIDRPAAEVARALEHLERHELVRPGASTWDFAHDLVRRATYARMSSPRRRVLHLAVARALEAHDDDGALAGDVARHASLGGDARLAATAAVRAGERSLRLFAYASAEAFFELGRREARHLPADVRVPIEARLYALVVHPGVKLRAPHVLGEELVRVAREAADLGLDEAHARALVLLARLYYHSWVDVPRARAALGQAVRLLEASKEATPEALVSGLRCLALVQADMARVRSALGAIAGLGDRVTESLYFQWAIGLVHAWEGDAVAARAALSRAGELARARSDHWAECECAQARALLELEEGDASAAARAADELGQIAARLASSGSEGPFAGALAALARGDVAAIDAAIRTLDRLDAGALAAQVRALAAEAALARGDAPAAERLADEARAIAARVSHPIEAARAHVVLGRARAARGDAAGARAAFAEAARAGDDLPARLRAILAAST